MYGTGFAVRNSLIPSIQTPLATSDSLSHLRLNTKQGSVLILSAYTGILDAEESVKNVFYEQLEEKLRTCSEKEHTVLLGDMNVRVGVDYTSWLQCL